ncbi:MAG: undecaprenyl-diphosphate phosphatase, partial [Desulfamplus sp.]|nr:undecaprenyl-diphosphate phosphatase [Desulfamplus sp.]
METYHALLLGIVQGLTEFLPVSSSGHLALGQYIFDIKEPTLFFDISLHIGTLLAVLIVFFDNIKSICISIVQMLKTIIRFNPNDFQKQFKENSDIRFVLLIVVASIPTAIIGLCLKPYVDILFDSINFVGTMLIITGTFLWLTKDIKKSGVALKKENKISKDDEQVVSDV